MKVNYESKVTWKEITDYLRCNPKFHNNPRYDCVMIQTTASKPIFAQLIFVFSITIGNTKYPLALVQTFDAPITTTTKDKDIGLHRLRAQPRIKSEIFAIASIIRGALLVKDYDTENDYLVMDIVDTDMFLRMKSLA